MNNRNKHNKNLDLLASDISCDKSIVLFCGAGINSSPKVHLLWPNLIEGPFSTALDKIAHRKEIDFIKGKYVKDVFKNSLLSGSKNPDKQNAITEFEKLRAEARYAFPYEIRTSILKKEHKKEYIPLLQEYIYNQCNEDRIKDGFKKFYRFKDKYLNDPSTRRYDINEGKEPAFYTLYILAKFILLYDKLEAVITYNYDNFLTCAIKILLYDAKNYFYKSEYEHLYKRWGKKENSDKVNCKVVDIEGRTYNRNIDKNTIAIFHVHGYIPSPEESENCYSSSIILSQDEYYDALSEVHSWQNSTQIHYLCHCTCLFAGSSMTDLTVKRMINFAKNNGNNEGIYNLNVFSNHTTTDDFSNDEEKIKWARKYFEILRNDYLESMGVRNIFYKGLYNELYEEIGKIIFLKTADKLININN